MAAKILQFKPNILSAQQSLVDYVNAVANVSGYAYSLVKTQRATCPEPAISYLR